MGKFGKVAGKLSKHVSRSVSKSPSSKKLGVSPKPKKSKGTKAKGTSKVKFGERATSAAKNLKKGTGKLVDKAKKLRKSKGKGTAEDIPESETEDEALEIQRPGRKDKGKGKKKKKSKKERSESREANSSGRGNKIGVKYQIFTVLLGLLIVLSLIGFILTAVLHLLGERYLWVSLGGKRILIILSLTGITSATSLLMSLFIMIFQLGSIKSKTLSSVTAIGTLIPLVIIFIGTFILFLITVLQHGNVVDIFGDHFLTLIENFDTDSKRRFIMNRIQIEFECCGHYEPRDWALEENQETVNLPFSCCSIYSLLPCSHEEISLTHYEEQGAGETIYDTGCKYPMEIWYKSILVYYILVAGAMCLCQLGLILLFYIVSRKPSSSSSANNRKE